MKKRIKSIALSTLFLLPMLLSGCDNPFGSSNNIGSSDGYTEIEPSKPSPGGGGGSYEDDEPEEDPGSGETYTLYNPYNYDEGKDPTGFVEISDSIGYVKSIYKKGATSLSAIEIANRKTAYEDYATTILTRLGREYGITNTGSPLNPLTNVGATTFKNLGLMPSGYSATEAEINAITDAFIRAKYIKTFTIAGSMQYALISERAFGATTPVNITYDGTNVNINTQSITLEKVFGGAVSILGTSYALSDSEAFYKVTKGSDTIYIIYKTSFVQNFGTNFESLVDTHRDAIRYNVHSLTSSSTSGETVYNLTTKPWKIYEDSAFSYTTDYVTSFASHYKNRVALELASVMAFGVNSDKTLNLPTSSAGSAYTSGNGTIDEFYAAAKSNTSQYSNYMNFVLKYIDHNGFVAYEADAIAEYLTNVIVGGGTNSVLAMDETRYTQNAFINLTGIEKTFNSNEMMTIGSTNTVRKLISDYSNSSARPFEKNSVFKTIKYASTVTDTTLSSSVGRYTIDGVQKYDERDPLFKNYYNTFYSACNGLVTGSTDDISLMALDSNYSYLQNVTIVEEGEEEEEEDTGEEGEEEEENYIYDTEYAGKLQSIVIFPKDKIDIRYMEVGVEAILSEGQALEITADLRYHVGGKVYYVPNAFEADGGGAGEVDSEEHIVNFEYKSGINIGDGLMFKDENNNISKEKLLSFRDCVGKNVPDLRTQKWSLIPWGWHPDGPGKYDATSSHFNYNQFASTMGANYIYNVKDYDFIEVCFNVKTKYDNFDTNYSINAKVTSVYGTKA